MYVIVDSSKRMLVRTYALSVFFFKYMRTYIWICFSK